MISIVQQEGEGELVPVGKKARWRWHCGRANVVEVIGRLDLGPMRPGIAAVFGKYLDTLFFQQSYAHSINVLGAHKNGIYAIVFQRAMSQHFGWNSTVDPSDLDVWSFFFCA